MFTQRRITYADIYGFISILFSINPMHVRPSREFNPAFTKNLFISIELSYDLNCYLHHSMPHIRDKTLKVLWKWN